MFIAGGQSAPTDFHFVAKPHFRRKCHESAKISGSSFCLSLNLNLGNAKCVPRRTLGDDYKSTFFQFTFLCILTFQFYVQMVDKKKFTLIYLTYTKKEAQMHKKITNEPHQW